MKLKDWANCSLFDITILPQINFKQCGAVHGDQELYKLQCYSIYINMQIASLWHADCYGKARALQQARAQVPADNWVQTQQMVTRQQQQRDKTIKFKAQPKGSATKCLLSVAPSSLASSI